MSVNVYVPHVLVLPEDDANRQIANGFLLNSSLKNARQIQVLQPAGGWVKVLHSFENDHVEKLRLYGDRYLVLLIDFDNRVEDRKAQFLAAIPADVQDRVFVLGTQSEPEPLRKQCGDSLENIGLELSGECFHDESTLWAHPLLTHNEAERGRLDDKVKSILF